YALGQFLEDLVARTKKADGDPTFAFPEFRMEAESLGLAFDEPEAILTRTEVQERPAWGSIEASNQLGFSMANSYIKAPIVSADTMVIGFVHEKIRPMEPDFAEIRDEVADMWAEENAGQIALDTLQSIFDGFATKTEEEESAEETKPEPVVVDDAKFRLAVEAAGLTITERPYLGRNKPVNEAREDQTDLGRFLRAHREYYDLEEGAIAPPAMAFTGTTAYLVRLADRRDPDLEGLKARDIFALRSTQMGQTLRDYRAEVFDPKSDYFQSTFKVWMRNWDRDAEQDAEGEGTPATEGGDA
ncbi:MAG: hypothetical protein KDB61_15210, partial [Planctomycetes bacterium]|nr:hypothetical protein [Planctomycetota bacterium]